MNFKKHEILYSVVASVAMLIIGYLLWRHENAVTQSEAGANAAEMAQQENDFQNELQSLQASDMAYGSGGAGFSEPNPVDQNSASSPSDNELAAILSAFVGSNQTPSNSGSTSPSDGSTSSDGGNTAPSGSGSNNTFAPIVSKPSPTPKSPVIGPVKAINRQHQFVN